MRAYKKPGRPPCSIGGCSQPLYCKGLCTTHYTRLRYRGDPGPAERERALPGGGSINGDGYRVLNDPSHPLATAQGKLLAHRVVLFAAIGDGSHPCHWCAKPLSWRGDASTRINADHLDFNKLNNERANLVASCLDCNTKRREHPRAPAANPRHRVYTDAQKEAARQRARDYYAANRERVLARMKASRKAAA